jgi:hypothetical protein
VDAYARLLEAKMNGTTRQLATRMFRERKPLFFSRSNQLAIAKKHGRSIVMAMLDA